MALPQHIEPMLAKLGEPFDSAEHLFEVKWDGVRAMTYVEGGRHRMHGRKRRDLAGRYPELQGLAGLPDGTVLDGELVVLGAGGRPDFPAILARENGTPARAMAAAKRQPVVYVVFDLLYAAGRALLEQPLVERRRLLAQLVAAQSSPRLLVSDGQVGGGLALFAAVQAQGLEGIVAKRLDAPYRPGERTDSWQKIKPVATVLCLILGYEADARGSCRSLIVAADFGSGLRCVGKVGSGLSVAELQRLQRRFEARRSPRPLVETGLAGHWVEPGLYCEVAYLERTANGNLRAPVYRRLVEEGGA